MTNNRALFKKAIKQSEENIKLEELSYLLTTHKQIEPLRNLIGIFGKYYTKQQKKTSRSDTDYCTIYSLYSMVTETQPTMLLDMVETTWLVTYLSRIVLQEELVGLSTYILVKYVSYIEKMQECLIKEKI